MDVHTDSSPGGLLESSALEIEALLCDSSRQVTEAGAGLEDLACCTHTILELAGAVISCIEDGSVPSILPMVQSLTSRARAFVQQRLELTSGMLGTVTNEARLLERLAALTRGQQSIGRETHMLSVLTHIEAARLGTTGAGFEHLGRQLDDSYQSVAKSTRELNSHTNERRADIEGTRRYLAVELPRVSRFLARVDGEMDARLAAVDSSLSKLTGAPAQFKQCVEGIEQQIAGVVAAIQVHDITRQQLEHVTEGLRRIAAMNLEECGEGDMPAQRPMIAAGLAIQAYQLKSVQRGMNEWVEQMRDCIEGILRISAAGLGNIGLAVLDNEKELSGKLVQIAEMEEECERGTTEIEGIFNGLSGLMELVSEHIERSEFTRDHLQLLTFNSIIEASRLGSEADAILEISHCIKRMFVEWSKLTEKSGKARDEILNLIDSAREAMSGAAKDDTLKQAQRDTQVSLETLRNAAMFAAEQAPLIDAAVSDLQARSEGVSRTGRRLDGCVMNLDGVLERIDALRLQLEKESPGSIGKCDAGEAETIFSASYTTESEREVLRAALGGGPLPASRHNLGGNDIELF